MNEQALKKFNLRALAAWILAKVLEEKRPLDDVLEQATTHLAEADYHLVKSLCYNACRYQLFYSYLAQQFVKKMPKPIALQQLIVIALFQICALRTPDYAVVNDSVQAAKQLGFIWAGGFINAVLRNFIREYDSARHDPRDNDLVHATSHPAWLVKLIQQDWPTDANAILASNNQLAPLTLRLNPQHIARSAYLELLQAQGIAAEAAPFSNDAVVCHDRCDPRALPGYQQGWFAVQDLAAQLAAGLMQLQPGQRLLDACSAPGGKLIHCLTAQPALRACVALDRDERRLVQVHENLQRLGGSATVKCADAAAVTDWWDGELFDRILLDAPCSAMGIIRRHPDLKLLRTLAEVTAIRSQQLALLTALWSVLAPGGLLLYATCSIFRCENDEIVSAFLADIADASVDPINADWGIATVHGRQLLPSAEHDGFYYARLIKESK